MKIKLLVAGLALAGLICVLGRRRSARRKRKAGYDRPELQAEGDGRAQGQAHGGSSERGRDQRESLGTGVCRGHGSNRRHRQPRHEGSPSGQGGDRRPRGWRPRACPGEGLQGRPRQQREAVVDGTDGRRPSREASQRSRRRRLTFLGGTARVTESVVRRGRTPHHCILGSPDRRENQGKEASRARGI